MENFSKRAGLQLAVTAGIAAAQSGVLTFDGTPARSEWDIVIVELPDGRLASTLVKHGEPVPRLAERFLREAARRSLTQDEADTLLEAHRLAGSVQTLQAAYAASQRPKTEEEVRAQFEGPESVTLTAPAAGTLTQAQLVAASRQLRGTTRQQERLARRRAQR